MNLILKYKLIPTKRRLTFEILFQDMKFCGKSDDDYLMYKAENGIEIISRSRMDIQTDRLWLLGCGPDERSGSMVFSSDEKRNVMMWRFHEALDEWAQYAPVFESYEEKFIWRTFRSDTQTWQIHRCRTNPMEYK